MTVNVKNNQHEINVSYKISNLTPCSFSSCSFPELELEDVEKLTLEQLTALIERQYVLLDFLNKEIWYFNEENGEEVLVGNFSY